VMTLIANCSLALPASGNTQHLLYPLLPHPINASTSTLFINAVRTFNFLIVHLVLKYKNFVIFFIDNLF